LVHPDGGVVVAQRVVCPPKPWARSLSWTFLQFSLACGAGDPGSGVAKAVPAADAARAAISAVISQDSFDPLPRRDLSSVDLASTLNPLG